MNKKITSLTDQPIRKVNSDLLEAEKYATALSSFILESDTPLTIGIQGEWGTGKTSLMYMLKEKIENITEEENYAIATSWVNTWEYSMFKGVDQTTPAVLKGMLEKLKESCGDNWTLTEDVENKIKKIGNFLGNVANQLISSQTGVNVKDAAGSDSSSFMTDIAEIKFDIKEVIAQLITDEKNPYQKVVFFIDDLDRIEPSDAVEVLEALKNIFDIHNCIFI
jgi:predicted KAP-like P-loop ATPase